MKKAISANSEAKVLTCYKAIVLGISVGARRIIGFILSQRSEVLDEYTVTQDHGLE
jgi:hypothetical protein